MHEVLMLMPGCKQQAQSGKDLSLLHYSKHIKKTYQAGRQS